MSFAELSFVGKLGRINQIILNPLIVLMFSLALVVFIAGILQMIANSESEEARETGKRNIVYGIIGMVIMISVYGIIRFIINTFGLDSPGYIL